MARLDKVFVYQEVSFVEVRAYAYPGMWIQSVFVIHLYLLSVTDNGISGKSILVWKVYFFAAKLTVKLFKNPLTVFVYNNTLNIWWVNKSDTMPPWLIFDDSSSELVAPLFQPSTSPPGLLTPIRGCTEGPCSEPCVWSSQFHFRCAGSVLSLTVFTFLVCLSISIKVVVGDRVLARGFWAKFIRYGAHGAWICRIVVEGIYFW